MADFVKDICGDDDRTALEALRRHLADALEGAEPRYKAPLARQLRDVMAQIRDLPAPVKDGVDELERKRSVRRAGSSSGPVGGVVGGAGGG